MHVFVRDHCTMITASVQCDVDGIPKGPHSVRVTPMVWRSKTMSFPRRFRFFDAHCPGEPHLTTWLLRPRFLRRLPSARELGFGRRDWGRRDWGHTFARDANSVGARWGQVGGGITPSLFASGRRWGLPHQLRLVRGPFPLQCPRDPGEPGAGVTGPHSSMLR
jgi:hypothetical protein